VGFGDRPIYSFKQLALQQNIRNKEKLTLFKKVSFYEKREIEMTSTAIFMMVLILGVIWGGFVLSLRTAMKKEKRKTKSDN
jgi:hypothetical protein